MDTRSSSKPAYDLTKILNAFSLAHGTPRFPIDVAALALETANLFRWSDPIVEVQAASLPSFEGALIGNDSRSKWLLLYNDQIGSEGRIRFTQAHELGHYVLHRAQRNEFRCSADDMVDTVGDDRSIETQADNFASTLLMPLDDFRQQVPASPSLESISAAAARYGVSLTAAALRWIHHTEACAVLVTHADGFIHWASSSKSAHKGGAFIRTKRTPVPVPEHSLAADSNVGRELQGQEIPASVWFSNAPSGLSLREMKLVSENFDFIMTLLVLPKGSKVWASFAQDRHGPIADTRERDRSFKHDG